MTVIIPQKDRDAVQFDPLAGAGKNSIAIFQRRWRGDPSHPTSIFRGANARKNEMKQLSKMTAAPSAALFALALAAMTPTAANAGEYCRTDVSSAMRSCSFDTMEQCQEMSSGRGGGCARDPFLADTNSAYAWQPKDLHSKGAVHAAKKPAGNR
jgi:hypothetical protein